MVITVIATFAGFFIHANVRWQFGPLEWLMATPAFHHWHHSCNDHTDHNYAATFPWIDRIFGTHYLPRHFPNAYGLEEKLPPTLVGQLIKPLRGRT